MTKIQNLKPVDGFLLQFDVDHNFNVLVINILDFGIYL